MLTVEEAQRRVLSLGKPLGEEELAVADAARRYLAAPVAARRDQPPADNSAMDGYAIRFADLPGPLDIIGESRAGSPFDGTIGASQAVAISTGALIPAGADTVLVREDAERDGDKVHLTGEGPGEQGRHIRRAGGDFRSAETLLKAGDLLTPGALALAISAGIGSVIVGKRPSLVILSTGDELAEPGSDAAAEQIYNSNGPMLSAMVDRLCADIRMVHAVADSEEAVRAAIREAEDADVLITIGGASVGEHDHVKGSLIAEGSDIEFWKVAMKPGKPLLAGRKKRQVVLGLPGNPGSAFVTATLFLLPLLRHLGGAASPLPRTGSARLLGPIADGGKRTEFLRARLTQDGIMPLAKQSSGLVSSLAITDALIEWPVGAKAKPVDDIVDYIAIG